MKVYARARKPDGSLVRMSYLGEEEQAKAQAAAGTRAEGNDRADGELSTAIEEGLSWWERWWMLGALEPSGYQRLF